MTLTEFLLARIAEDEAVAQAAIERSDRVWENESRLGRVWTVENDEDRVINMPALRSPLGPHIARHDPARVLAECDAKRRIVGRGSSECGGFEDQEQFGSHHYPDPEWSHCDGCWAAESADRDWTWTLAALALPYADHPDYREEWRL